MITEAKAKELLERYGIKTREELQKELKENPINIAVFIQNLNLKDKNLSK